MSTPIDHMLAATDPTPDDPTDDVASRFSLMNPVLARELRQRMSTPRIMIVISLYLLILGAVLVLLYRVRSDLGSVVSQPGVTQLSEIGQSLFEFVLFFMTLLVLFIVPGFTAASIAGERERQTLRALQVTLLSPLSIVIGKVAASVALTLLLLVVSMPLLAVAYLVGGITFDEVFVSLGILLFSAVGLACITVACSALMKRVSGAILMAYGIVLVLVFGSFVAYAVAGEYDRSRGVDAVNVPSWVLAANPLAAVAEVSDRAPTQSNDVVFGPFGPSQYNDSPSPLGGIRYFMHDAFNDSGRFNQFDGPFPQAIPVDPFGNPLPGFEEVEQGFDARPGGPGRISYIVEFMICFAALALFGVIVSARRITTPARVDR